MNKVVSAITFLKKTAIPFEVTLKMKTDLNFRGISDHY